MAVISAANIKWYLSGAGSNSDPAQSYGGAISTVEVTPGTLFDDVTGDEANSGKVYYRCVYLKNTDANAGGWISPYLWVSTDVSAAGDAVAIAQTGNAKNASAEAKAADEFTAPSGPSFTKPTTKGGGILLKTGPYVQNDYIAIWIRRTIGASTAAYNNETFTLSVEGDSSA